MRFQSRFQRFMNHRAPANGRYKPTCYEHAANCYTHAFLIVPAIVGSALLHRLSDDCWEKITAWIYGMGLCALFIVSTVFHIVAWKKSHLRTVEHWFHMCDRMVIYFFIAASYAPWLNLRELGPLASHMRWFIWLMAAGGTIYVFLYHEKYKVIELFFYLTMGFSPALVVTSMVKEQSEKSPSSLFDPAEHHGAYVNFEDGAGPRPRPGSSRLALCPLWPSPSPRHRQPTHRGPPVPSLLDFCRALLQGSQGCRAQASRTPTLLSLPRPGHKLLTTRMDFTNLPAGA
ncbi:monocyte to macrophage differentiation factor isoform X1 [Bubalus bubalis]|uniref:monocyte to macrophage differentiation factor isoform X1 n=2 Tax=Bubalus bubalis TaxID=89462 RepID=UPI000DBC7D50|nr:monocyte to macrophage differentiation factor isoform X1 [Bubalus bubalis]